MYNSCCHYTVIKGHIERCTSSKVRWLRPLYLKRLKIGWRSLLIGNGRIWDSVVHTLKGYTYRSLGYLTEKRGHVERSPSSKVQWLRHLYSHWLELGLRSIWIGNGNIWDLVVHTLKVYTYRALHYLTVKIALRWKYWVLYLRTLSG